jgi:hypothetical protein
MPNRKGYMSKTTFTRINIGSGNFENNSVIEW